MNRSLLTVVPLALLCSAVPAQSQHPICPDLTRPGVDLADAGSQRLRAAQLAAAAPLTSLTIRRPSLERKAAICASETAQDSSRATWSVALLPVRSRVIYNSAYPLNVNNGAIWSGVGAAASMEAGADFRVGPLNLSLYPLIAYQQNSDFPTRQVNRRGASIFEYAGHPNIDWPQRHGDEPFWTMHPGQSSMRLESWGLAVGVSTENLWIGPAQRMPIMMSSTAAGFPHVYLSTTGPLHTPIGSVEGQLFWGKLKESDYFDNDPDNDHNLLVGTTVVWQPRFLDGLFLGAHRSHLVAFDQPDWSVFDYAVQPYVDLRGNPTGDNKLMSIFGRWVLPAAGFEVYGEWAREDHWGEWVDFLREIDHSQAFLLGLQKLTRSGGATLRWWGELANLQHSLVVRGGRGTQTLYVHGELRQGYTHRGQLLGAWIGPGSNSQIIGVERIRGDRVSGIALERVRFDADAYYTIWARFYGEAGHDASIALWLRHLETLGPLQFAATGSVARRQNRNFVHFTGAQPADLRWETNAHLDVELRWVPGR
jgi:hypothetical protein